MKFLVAYYSKTGNNKYLAEKIAYTLACDIEAIKPRLDFFPLLALFTLGKVSAGVRPLAHTVSGYDRIILCGPIWMGMLVSPLRDCIARYRAHMKGLCFATCCGSDDTSKDTTFGYARTFLRVKRMAGDACVLCEAFPIGLVVPGDKKNDGDTIMKTRLSDDNFIGPIQTRFEGFLWAAAHVAS